MPVGVNVRTSTRSAPATPQRNAASTYFVVGQTERGSTVAPTKVTSMFDVERLLGGYIAAGNVYRDLVNYFEENGTAAYVQRVVGPGATSGTRTLVDRAGTPLNTLRIDAISAGAWSANVSIAVVAGTLANTYQIQVIYSGVGSTGVEVYDNLSTPADAVSALGSSAYVRATNLGSATAAPNNQPAILAASALTAGADDATNVTITQLTAGLALFTDDLGAGAVAAPGYASSVVGAALATHAAANNRIALTAVAAGSSSAQAVAAVAALRVAAPNALEFTGLFWPNIVVPDGKGGRVTVTPEGYVAACRARAHEAAGPARAPAGTAMGQAQYVLGIEAVTVSTAQLDSANDSGVSTIRTKLGLPTLYGWRSLSLDDNNYHLLTSRDTLNYIAVQVKLAMEQYVFRTIDAQGRLFTEMRGTALGILEPLRQQDQLYEKYNAVGQIIDPGYSVDTGAQVNTPTTLAANQANILIAARPSPSSELLNASVVKVPLTANV